MLPRNRGNGKTFLQRYRLNQQRGQLLPFPGLRKVVRCVMMSALIGSALSIFIFAFPASTIKHQPMHSLVQSNIVPNNEQKEISKIVGETVSSLNSSALSVASSAINETNIPHKIEKMVKIQSDKIKHIWNGEIEEIFIFLMWKWHANCDSSLEAMPSFQSSDSRI